jgi:hypothetical protein
MVLKNFVLRQIKDPADSPGFPGAEHHNICRKTKEMYLKVQSTEILKG